ncbi:MAG: hypothetical protein ACKERG_00135 [Candidatus Hodgkinia cicadicola]
MPSSGSNQKSISAQAEQNSFDFEVSAYSLEGVSLLRQNLRLLSSKVQKPSNSRNNQK